VNYWGILFDSSAVTHPLAYCVIMCYHVGIATPMEEWYKAELSLFVIWASIHESHAEDHPITQKKISEN